MNYVRIIKVSTPQLGRGGAWCPAVSITHLETIRALGAGEMRRPDRVPRKGVERIGLDILVPGAGLEPALTLR